MLVRSSSSKVLRCGDESFKCALLSTLEGDEYAPLGPQGDQGLGLYRVPRDGPEAVPLGDGRQDQHALGHGEVLPDALPRAP